MSDPLFSAMPFVPAGKLKVQYTSKGESDMKVTTSGIDVAKSVFQVHGVDEHGTVVLRRQLRRSQFVLFFSRLEPCVAPGAPRARLAVAEF
jgi:hypothetical protein